MTGTETTRVDPATYDRVAVRIERRSLLVVGGLPGAGKSTLLRGLEADVPVTVLDADQVRARLRRLLPAGTPYSWYRPFVHLLQLARLVAGAFGAAGPLVVHDPATGPLARTAFRALGALTGRTRHLLWLDCTPEAALAGQRARGRVLLGWSFTRHARNAPRLRGRLLAGDTPSGWHSGSIIDRAAARRGLRLQVREGVSGTGDPARSVPRPPVTHRKGENQ
ncbi:AAA family ATPase [Amycolatopsis palatopharyngis]|uniref:AAA family ATPase n=1 Tax=Amycolatopsis palatopharyngis TaxID=187982 RepID=UPI000E256562|nr:AAA family ATPase [Amycolatopsis palatopharyngis]